MRVTLRNTDDMIIIISKDIAHACCLSSFYDAPAAHDSTGGMYISYLFGLFLSQKEKKSGWAS